MNMLATVLVLFAELYKRALHEGRVVGAAWTAHHELQAALIKGGVNFRQPHDDSSTIPPPDLAFECMWCAKCFPTRRQWQNHLWSAHGRTSEERLYMTSVVCAACHKCFWTTNRLQIHLRNSRALDSNINQMLPMPVSGTGQINLGFKVLATLEVRPPVRGRNTSRTSSLPMDKGVEDQGVGEKRSISKLQLMVQADMGIKLRYHRHQLRPTMLWLSLHKWQLRHRQHPLR